MLSNDMFTTNLRCIAIDEVHKVSWGKVKDTEKPFREVFGELSILRSICRQGVPILALSATIVVNLTQLVKESCSLSRKMKFVTCYVDRPNIRLSTVPTKAGRTTITHTEHA